ncbi:GNAT family N-acetyltransferase [Dictyobacter aurantiacus]|uniref:Ribosomal-protein-serine acetyltransferase n=1 Tax=Dictyobacter aurantiacus TaxID=1936993 RepID=A0A401ZMK0_9CHLR|nr:GNAT family protein [Dictyobacter aurantiacus]GCE08083.1 ribosomal-protein-serine acetyltransferase [Dictyobacter aurantiacus]
MSTLGLCIRVDDEIELRLHELRYAEAYHALVVRNIEHLREWMPWAAEEQTLEGIKNFMSSSMHRFADGTGLPTNLWYRGQLVGSIGYPRMSWQARQAEIGYWLDKDMQGKGIITRATKALVTYAFEELGLNKVEIHAASGNYRSRAVPERLGFRQEGTLRQTVWVNGQVYDMIIYGMLASEWHPSTSTSVLS